MSSVFTYSPGKRWFLDNNNQAGRDRRASARNHVNQAHSMGYLSARLASPRGACTELTSLLPCSHALMVAVLVAIRRAVEHGGITQSHFMYDRRSRLT